MFNVLKYFFILIFLYLAISCGSSKQEIDMEDETAESIMQKSQAAIDSKNYDEALKLDSLMLLNFPTSDLHIDAQLNMAKALGGKEEYEQQLDLLLRILQENIVPEKVPSIYAQIGEHYEDAALWNPNTVTSDSMDWAKAAQYYRKAVFYPDSDDDATKAKSLYRAALLYAKLNQIDVAARAYDQTIAFYPESIYSAMAKIKLRDPGNTDEIDPNSEQMAGFVETTLVEPEEEIPFEPEQLDEETSSEEIKEMIEIPQDTTATDIPNMEEMAPELYEPTQEDTLGQDLGDDAIPAEFDTTSQEIE
jgi:tetratricopeptide (TPR) repeat protein